MFTKIAVPRCCGIEFMDLGYPARRKATNHHLIVRLGRDVVPVFTSSICRTRFSITLRNALVRDGTSKRVAGIGYLKSAILGIW